MGNDDMDDLDVMELEEGESLELPPRDDCEIKTDIKFENFYTVFEELGKGKFGVVSKCKRNEDGLELAAKYIRKTAASKKEVLREIEMMNLLHHKRLISLFDAYETPRHMIVVMELVTGGELFEKIVEDDNLSEKQVIRYMRQVLYGVQHMHRKNMVHLDLKPENILCLGGGKPGYEEIKLIDFGMTRVLKEGVKETALCGTPEFVAPEVITFNPITLAADMWSLGVITYVLLSGLSPFMGDDDNETLRNVTLGDYDYEDEDNLFDELSDVVKEFIDSLLILKPSDRLTVDDCLEHTWLKKVGSDKKIATTNLKNFIARRRWQKTMNTLKAVSRLAGGLSEKAGSHGAKGGKGSFLAKVKAQVQADEAMGETSANEKDEAEEENHKAESPKEETAKQSEDTSVEIKDKLEQVKINGDASVDENVAKNNLKTDINKNIIASDDEAKDKLSNGLIKNKSNLSKNNKTAGVAKRTTSKPQVGGVASRIAAFQHGDAYNKTKKK